MNPNLYHASASLSSSSREMLFVGFRRDFDANICNYPHHDDTYRYEVIDQAERAYDWLCRRVDDLETYQLPYAVFLELEWLLHDDFLFLKRLTAHADLRFVPVIVLTQKGMPVDRSRLLHAGADDCYTSPIEWERLSKRLEFLNQFKSRVLEYASQAHAEDFSFRISRGKRLFDVVTASAALALTAPIWLLTALAIKLESEGPVFYRAKRVGAGYQTFDFLKFRSMYTNADQQLAGLWHLNQYNGGDSCAVFIKLAGDPRVTRVGRFIRKYSIDELPQLINVLRGEMSLVGNRPLPLYEAQQLTCDAWSARFLAPAGLTGLWQVTKRGRNDMSAEERIQLDISYSQQNASLWRDLKIVFKTFNAFIQKEAV